MVVNGPILYLRRGDIYEKAFKKDLEKNFKENF